MQQGGFVLVAVLIFIGVLAMLLVHYLQAMHMMSQLFHQNTRISQIELAEKHCLKEAINKLSNDGKMQVNFLQLGKFSTRQHCTVIHHDQIDYRLIPLALLDNNLLVAKSSATVAIEILISVTNRFIKHLPALSAVWWHAFPVSPVQNKLPLADLVIKPNQIHLNVGEHLYLYPLTQPVPNALIRVASNDATIQLYYAQGGLLNDLQLPLVGQTLKRLWQYHIPYAGHIISLAIWGCRLWFVVKNGTKMFVGVINRFSGQVPHHPVFVDFQKAFKAPMALTDVSIKWQLHEDAQTCHQVIDLANQQFVLYAPRYHCGLQMLRLR